MSSGDCEVSSSAFSRDLGWSTRALASARATLATHGDRVNAAHAGYLATFSAECSGTGELLRMDDADPLCLTCADLDHLVFLSALLH